MTVFATLGSAVLEQSQDLHPAVAGHFPRGDLTTLALTDAQRLIEAAAILPQGTAGRICNSEKVFPPHVF